MGVVNEEPEEGTHANPRILQYNKWMFSGDRLNFPFPLFTTSLHMLVQFCLSSIVLFFVPSLRPRNGHVSDGGQSRHEAGPKAPLMTKMFYLTRIGPCGAATGLDIGLGNTSLKFITLTFYSMSCPGLIPSHWQVTNNLW